MLQQWRLNSLTANKNKTGKESEAGQQNLGIENKPNKVGSCRSTQMTKKVLVNWGGGKVYKGRAIDLEFKS